MRGYIFLCDYAEEIGGKLYIMGGGWTRILRQHPLVTMSVAGKLFVSWAETNVQHHLSVALVTPDGAPVLAPDEAPIELKGHLEVGRPAGVTAGTELDLSLAFRFADLSLEPERYRWDLKVDDEPIADVTFDLVAPHK